MPPRAGRAGFTDNEERRVGAEAKKLDKMSRGTAVELGNAQNLLDGITDATWTPPSVKDVHQKLAGDPKLVEALAGPAPKVLSDPEYGMTQMERAQKRVTDAQQRVVMTTGDVATHQAEVYDFNERVDTYNKDVHAYNAACRRPRRGGTPRRRSSPGSPPSRSPSTAGGRVVRSQDAIAKGQLRDIDIKIVDAAEPAMGPGYAERMQVADTLIDNYDDTALRLENSGDARQGEIADTLRMFGGLSSVKYDQLSRDSRALGNTRLKGLSLPSTGTPDFTLAQNSAIRLPTYGKDLKVLDKSPGRTTTASRSRRSGTGWTRTRRPTPRRTTRPGSSRRRCSARSTVSSTSAPGSRTTRAPRTCARATRSSTRGSRTAVTSPPTSTRGPSTWTRARRSRSSRTGRTRAPTSS